MRCHRFILILLALVMVGCDEPDRKDAARLTGGNPTQALRVAPPDLVAVWGPCWVLVTNGIGVTGSEMRHAELSRAGNA